MKRIVTLLLTTALLAQAGGAFAHADDFDSDSDEISGRSVLEEARSRYFRFVDSLMPQADEERSEAAEERTETGRVYYTPVVLSFVPMISVPFGYYDTTLAAGLIGVMTRDVNGIEGSSVFNISRDIHGLQGAGVFNISGDIRGLQGAGVFNMAEGVRGAQGAGVFNIANAFRGFQGAGVFNIAHGDSGGFQGAGVFNIADSIRGVQGAGVFNIAGKITGLQMGLVNVADNIDGIQLGLINIAGNSVDSIGFAYEPATDYLYATGQIGTPALYTVATIGTRNNGWSWSADESVASLGLGSRSRFLGLNLDLDLMASQPLGALPFASFDWAGSDWTTWSGWSLLKPYPTMKISLGMRIGQHLQILGGLKVDVEVASLGERVPAALKQGESWNMNAGSESLSFWPKWFFGVKI
jgi:hypothetical protein